MLLADRLLDRDHLPLLVVTQDPLDARGLGDQRLGVGEPHPAGSMLALSGKSFRLLWISYHSEKH